MQTTRIAFFVVNLRILTFFFLSRFWLQAKKPNASRGAKIKALIAKEPKRLFLKPTYAIRSAFTKAKI